MKSQNLDKEKKLWVYQVVYLQSNFFVKTSDVAKERTGGYFNNLVWDFLNRKWKVQGGGNCINFKQEQK